jgi:hypothetical protein
MFHWTRTTVLENPPDSILSNNAIALVPITATAWKAAQRLKHWLGEVGGFFGTKKVTALPSPSALTCYILTVKPLLITSSCPLPLKLNL